ncbi:MAG: hypothetical protein KDA88_06520 [Planctomycetaceae bacterium]|nr:hypothetical protein [Planctomycetaceae bacterium]MCB9953002.1 hypothetical protein [Planctomycetaceae bacterium]
MSSQFASSSFPRRLLLLFIALMIPALLGCEPPRPESSSVEQAAEVGNVPLDIPPTSLGQPTDRQVQPTPTHVVSPEQQIADLSAILAHRERMRQYGDIPLNPAWHENPPDPPRAMPAFRDPSFNVHMQQVCGEWLPIVHLYPGTKATLEDLLKVESIVPFGVEFQFEPENGDFLATLEEHVSPMLVHLTVGLTNLSVDDCRRLGELPHLKSVRLGSMSAEKFAAVTASDGLEAITIAYLHEDFGAAELAASLQGLRHLKRLRVGHPRSLPSLPVDALLETLGQLPQMEYIEIEPQDCSREAVTHFMTNCEHTALRTLRLNSHTTFDVLEKLNRLPNLEELSLHASIHSERIPNCIQHYQGKNLQKLTLIPFDDYNNPEGPIAFGESSSAKIVKALSRHESLEKVDVPLQLSAPGILEPLTRLPRLRVLHIKDFDLNYESLKVLVRMPRLDHLDVRSLEFGPEVNHLLPWLSIRTLYIDNPATLIDERARQLGQVPRLWHVSYWDAPSIDFETMDEIPQIEFQEYD